PRLTCRLPGGHDPVRIVLAGPALRLPARARVLARGGPPTWVVAPRGAPAARVAALRRRGVEVLLVAGRRERVPFAALVRLLGARGITSLLVEGGGTVAAEALRARAAPLRDRPTTCLRASPRARLWELAQQRAVMPIGRAASSACGHLGERHPQSRSRRPEVPASAT